MGPHTAFAGMTGHSRSFLTVLFAAVLVLALTACSNGVDRPSIAYSPSPTPAPIAEAHAFASVNVSANTLVPGSLKSVVAVPPQIQVAPGQTIELGAQSFDGQGRPATNVSYKWKVVDSRAGRVVHPLTSSRPPEFEASNTPGQYNGALLLTATQPSTSGPVTVSQTVDVTIAPVRPHVAIASVQPFGGEITAAPGQIVRLQAVAYDALGRVIPYAQFQWRLNEGTLGSINALGYLTVKAPEGRYPGALTVTATYQSSTASATIPLQVVGSANLAKQYHVYILPSSLTLNPGQTWSLNAVVLNGLGESANVAGRWQVTNPEAGTVSSDGVLTAGTTTGEFTNAIQYSATPPGASSPVTASASLSITAPPAASPIHDVTVNPGSSVLVQGGGAWFHATAEDASGNPVSGAKVTWRVTKPSIGTIDKDGRFTARGAPGTYPQAIQATVAQSIDGQTTTRVGFADVTIAGPVATVQVVPATTTVPAGNPALFRALAFDANGVQVPGVIFHWSMADPEAGTIDLAGNFTAGSQQGSFPRSVKVTALQYAADGSP